MPVPPTPDNPHGWGFIENREVLSHYQLSPRVQIVVGDIIKVSKGPYWVKEDGAKASLDTMRGKWKVIGIFNAEDGIEMDIIHCWPGGLLGSRSTIRVTGGEYPSPVVDSITRRPYKIKLATPKHGKRSRKSKKIEKSDSKNPLIKDESKTDWSSLANIIKEASSDA